MLIKTPDLIKPSEITDRQLYLNRRKFIRAGANLGITGALLNTFSITAALAGTKLSSVKNREYSTDEELTHRMTQSPAITTSTNSAPTKATRPRTPVCSRRNPGPS